MRLQARPAGITVAGSNGGGQLQAQRVAVPDRQQRVAIGQFGSLPRQQIADVDGVQTPPGFLEQDRAVAAADRLLVGILGLALGQHPALQRPVINADVHPQQHRLDRHRKGEHRLDVDRFGVLVSLSDGDLAQQPLQPPADRGGLQDTTLLFNPLVHRSPFAARRRSLPMMMGEF